MALHPVARLDELPPGSRRIVDVAGRSIGVFNIDGRLYALRNRCPHQGSALCEGPVLSFLESDGPGNVVAHEDHKLLQCPWHSWEFDMETGQSWFDPQRTRVRGYQVSVHAGAEVAEWAKAAGLEPGPYVAETFAVSVDADYIVVEVPE
jgi:3-phenylpropionate/trans-cinnamate dioxygenase ferredoxin subunit